MHTAHVRPFCEFAEWSRHAQFAFRNLQAETFFFSGEVSMHKFWPVRCGLPTLQERSSLRRGRYDLLL